jgi:hypothetical protein
MNLGYTKIVFISRERQEVREKGPRGVEQRIPLPLNLTARGTPEVSSGAENYCVFNKVFNGSFGQSESFILSLI